MKDIDHIAPLFKFYFPNAYMVFGRGSGRNLVIFNLCKELVSDIKFDYEKDFTLSPKQIKKVKNRKHRKACYQSFALYKKSFKPKRLPRFRFIKDDCLNIKYDDHIDAISAMFSSKSFYQQYMAVWGNDTENQVFQGWDGIKGVVHRDRSFD